MRDSKVAGVEVGLSRAMIEVKGDVLRKKFERISAQVDQSIENEEDRACRIDGLMVRAKWGCESIADSMATLAAMPEEPKRRDDLMRGMTTELLVLAELSTGQSLANNDWKKSLAILQERAEAVISSGDDSVESLNEIDLVVDRIERADELARDALKSYFKFLAI